MNSKVLDMLVIILCGIGVAFLVVKFVMKCVGG